MDYREIKTLKEQVGHWLAESEACRNDDALLVTTVCARHNYNPIEKASSIERCRRWWQSQGKFLPTDERVARARKMNIDEWRVAMGYPTRESVGTGAPSYVPPSEITQGTLL